MKRWMLAGVLLVAMPACAKTECAWVLWGQPQGAGCISANRWRPLGSYPSRRKCLETMAVVFGLPATFPQGDDVVTSFRMIRRTNFAGQEGVQEHGLCLPDTASPK